jgi:hypothetical protein
MRQALFGEDREEASGKRRFMLRRIMGRHHNYTAAAKGTGYGEKEEVSA